MLLYALRVPAGVEQSYSLCPIKGTMQTAIINQCSDKYHIVASFITENALEYSVQNKLLHTFRHFLKLISKFCYF